MYGDPKNPGDRYFLEWVRSRDILDQRKHELELAKSHVASLSAQVESLTTDVSEKRERVLKSTEEFGNSGIAELLNAHKQHWEG